MKRKSLILIIIGIVVLSTTVTGVLFSGIFWARQEGNIHVIGIQNESMITLFRLGTIGNLTSNGLVIPISPEMINMSLGQNKSYAYTIINYDEQHSYNITFSIDNYWFENETNPFYGFRYGLNSSTCGSTTYYPDLNGKTITLLPYQSGYCYRTINFCSWFSVDSLMITPPEGTNIPINITISAVAI